MYRILLIEDDEGTRISLAASLRVAWERYCEAEHICPLSVHYAVSLGDAKKHLAEHQFAAVILDLKLPDSKPAQTLEWLAEHAPKLPPVVVITFMEAPSGASGWEMPALTNGASDFLPKSEIFCPSGGQRLMSVMLKAIARGTYLAKRREAHGA